MSETDTFDRILESLHEAALDDARWPAASALIDDALGARGNSLVVGADRPEGVRIFYAGFFCRGERYTEWERAYFDDYYPRDERIPRLRKLPDSRLTHCRDLYTDEERKSSPAYNEALSVGHTQDSINVRMDGPNGSRIVWVVNDPVDAGGWSSPQLDLIRRLLPHIRQYVRVRQALTDAGVLRSSLSGLLDRSRFGVIQLDRHARIVEANDRARGLLGQDEGLSDADGFLSATAPRDNRVLQRLLARAVPPLDAPGSSGSMTVTRPSASTRLVVHAVPVSARRPRFGGNRVAVLVLVADPELRPRIDVGLVQSALGLTPTEGQLAAMVAVGQRVRDIAARTGRTEGTVRWHLNRIFRKQGISGQADLMQRVLSLDGLPRVRS